MIIQLLIILLVVVAAFWIVSQMALKPPFDMIVRVIIGVVGLILLLGLLGIKLP